MSRFEPSMFLLPILLTLAAIDCTAAEPEHRGPVTLTDTSQYVLRSEIVDQSFRIDIGLPGNYRTTEQHYPVVYVLDSNIAFGMVIESSRALRYGAELPDILLVGIGYEVASSTEVTSLRSRDLTPTNDKVWTQEARNAPPPFALPADITPGGADDFLRFIEKELKPFINATFRTDPDNETLVGYSLGGLFGLHVLFNHHDSFDKYVVGSPSIWWDEKVSFSYEEGYAEDHADLAKTLVISSGSLESGSMVPHARMMYETLKGRGYPALDMHYFLLDGETHLSGIGASMNRGLKLAFESELARSDSAD